MSQFPPTKSSPDGASPGQATPTEALAGLAHPEAGVTSPGPGPDGGPRLQVPGYEILGELGRGGMGVVYKARHLALDRVVALKMIRSGACASAEELARLRREAEVLARLQHANIVQIYEVGEHDGLPYLALEFVGGGTLGHYLAGSPLPPRRAARFLEVLARAVHAAHEQGVVHRDLKPANILLGARGQGLGAREEEVPSSLAPSPWPLATPKITDFGLAKRLDLEPGSPAGGHHTRTGVVVGTPGYMAPEQAEGDPERLGPATDVYALGAILYECLTGRPPFQGHSPVDTLLRSLRDEPLPPTRYEPRVGPDLETICLKCLQKEPARRYGTAAGLADDLRRFLAGEPIRARPISTWERGVKWARRRPALAALLATTAAAILLVLAILTTATMLLVAANERERQATAAAEARALEAQQQRMVAASNLLRAREAVDRFHVRVTESPALKAIGLELLRLQLLQTAQEFYEGFVRDGGNDPALGGDRGGALRQLAIVYRELGLSQSAEKTITQAVDALRAAADAHPREDVYRENLCLCLHEQAMLFLETGRFDQAERSFREVKALRQQLADARPDDAGRQHQLAICDNNLGEIYRSIGRLDVAEEAFRKALPVFRHLANDYPKIPAYRQDQALTANNLGRVLRATGRTAAAEELFQEALALRRTLADGDARNQLYQEELAQTYADLGNLYRDGRRFDAAAEAHQKSLAIVRRLNETHPELPQYQSDVAAGYQNLGQVYADQGQAAEAEKAYRQAVALQRQLVAKQPEVVRFADGLANTCIALGLLAKDKTQAAAGLKWSDEAIATLVPVLRKAPRDGTIRASLQNAYNCRARMLRWLGRHLEAADAWDQAVQLFPQKQGSEGYRLARACARARGGDHAAAVAEAGEVAAQPGLTGDALYNLACVYSLASAAARGDAKLPPAERDQRPEQYAARAVEFLARTRDAGYFKSADAIRHMKEDSDLDLLRQRADFRNLAAAIEGR
jgi:serine/threonine protein kinase/tetratricopeptide (TPR) repeat protein